MKIFTRQSIYDDNLRLPVPLPPVKLFELLEPVVLLFGYGATYCALDDRIDGFGACREQSLDYQRSLKHMVVFEFNAMRIRMRFE